MPSKNLWQVSPRLCRGIGVLMHVLSNICSSRCRAGVSCCETFTTRRRVSSQAY